MQTILAIDDEPGVRQALTLCLGEMYRVETADDGAGGLKVLSESHVDLVLLDMVMPRMGGLEVLDEIQKREPRLPVIIVTALKSVATAVEAMKRGAVDYLIKPFDVEEILMLVAKTLAETKKDIELNLLREENRSGFESIIGESSSLMETLTSARRAMEVDSTVLITGESGTGKDLLARAIHYGGPRANEAFVALSCCAIPENLVESELFGHERGAFTGAVEKRVGKVQVADGGTLFLDEIGEMPLDAQAKLLRLIQEGEFYPVGSARLVEANIRFVCATNRNLQQCVSDGTFREDLFYRINVLPLEMPPLRKRREDIPSLIGHFLERHRTKVNARAEEFDGDALTALTAYEWPGNIRELANLVERTLVHWSREKTITAKHLEGILPDTGHAASSAFAELEGLPLEEATQRLERQLILRALERCDYVQSRAAERLGTTRRILKYKMDQLQMDPPVPSDAGVDT